MPAGAATTLQFVHVNELHGDAAHLLLFDSVHGRWDRDASGDGSTLTLDRQRLGYSQAARPADVPGDADVVLECTGRFRTIESLQLYFDRGARKVVVAVPRCSCWAYRGLARATRCPRR